MSPSGRPVVTVAIAALLAVPSVAACMGCPAALAFGTLVAQANELVLVAPGGGPTERITWPDGYSIRRDNGVLAVADLLGFVRARAGDYVELGGGESGRGTFKVCGDFKVNPSPRTVQGGRG